LFTPSSPSTLYSIRFFLSPSAPHPPLHSFPTRRSSDLFHRHHPRPDARAHDRRRPRSVLAPARRRPTLPLEVGRRRRARLRQPRSEEHTSELQSRFDLVCRLLLEKKKKNKQHHITSK